MPCAARMWREGGGLPLSEEGEGKVAYGLSLLDASPLSMSYIIVCHKLRHNRSHVGGVASQLFNILKLFK
jgi:hypothetical protein